MTEYMHIGKRECAEMGKVWVDGYRKKDGTYVHGYCRDKTEEEMRRTPSMLEDRYKENDMEIEKRIKEIKELVESGRETQEGIAVPDNGEYEYILYELFEDKNIENGYADALIGFNREKMGEWKDIINKYNNAFLKSYRYFVYDKGNKRFMTVEEMEEK